MKHRTLYKNGIDLNKAKITNELDSAITTQCSFLLFKNCGDKNMSSIYQHKVLKLLVIGTFICSNVSILYKSIHIPINTDFTLF